MIEFLIAPVAFALGWVARSLVKARPEPVSVEAPKPGDPHLRAILRRLAAQSAEQTAKPVSPADRQLEAFTETLKRARAENAGRRNQ